MKKLIHLFLLLSASAASVCGASNLQFTSKRGSVSHEMRIENLILDARGVPSFSYVYSQHAPGCAFTMAGKAIAGYDDEGGAVELEVYNPQGENGVAMPQIVAFHDGRANFTIPYKDMLRPKSISFDTVLDHATRAQSCEKKSERIEVLLKKKLP